MSILAIIISGIAAFMVGALWYTVLFGKAWMKEVRLTEEEIKTSGSGTPQMIISALFEVLTAALVFFALSHTDLNPFCMGAVIAVISVISSLKNYFFELKSWKLISINESYKVVCIMIMAAAYYFFD